MPDNKVEIRIEVDTRTGIARVKGFADAMEDAGRKGERGLEHPNRALDGMKARLTTTHGLVKSLGAAFAALGLYKLARETLGLMADSVKAASDLVEVTNKFGVVFAGQMEAANKWAQNLFDNYGLSTRAARQYLSSVQDLLVPMGMAAGQAGILSHEIVKLSVDLGSFNNLPTAQVMDDIMSALVGNYETMKKYGVVINATIVEQKALNMGLAQTKGELTVAQKAQAAYTLMVESSKAAVGDFTRTQGEYANQLKIFQRNVEELKAAFGEKLLPVFNDLLKQINKFAGSREIQQWAKDVGEGLKALMPLVTTMTGLLIQTASYWASFFKSPTEEQALVKKSHELFDRLTDVRQEIAEIRTGKMPSETTAIIRQHEHLAKLYEEEKRLMSAIANVQKTIAQETQKTIAQETQKTLESIDPKIIAQKIEQEIAAKKKLTAETEAQNRALEAELYFWQEWVEQINKNIQAAERQAEAMERLREEKEERIKSWEAEFERLPTETWDPFEQGMEAGKDGIKEFQEAWDRAWDRMGMTISAAISDGFTEAWDAAKDFFDNLKGVIYDILGETLGNEIKSGLKEVMEGFGMGGGGFDWGAVKGGFGSMAGGAMMTAWAYMAKFIVSNIAENLPHFWGATDERDEMIKAQLRALAELTASLKENTASLNRRLAGTDYPWMEQVEQARATYGSAWQQIMNLVPGGWVQELRHEPEFQAWINYVKELMLVVRDVDTEIADTFQQWTPMTTYERERNKVIEFFEDLGDFAADLAPVQAEIAARIAQTQADLTYAQDFYAHFAERVRGTYINTAYGRAWEEAATGRFIMPVEMIQAELAALQELNLQMKNAADGTTALAQMEQYFSAQRGDVMTEMTRYWQEELGLVTDLEKELWSLNDRFDAWIDRLKDLGATEEELARAEKMRADAAEAAAARVRDTVSDMLAQFMGSMSTSALAPVQSLAAFERRYGELVSAARTGGESEMQALLSYLQGEYLPFWKEYGPGDYAGRWEKMFGAGGELSHLTPSGTNQAQQIGEATAKALGPMLLDIADAIRDGGEISITVDGRVIATVVANQYRSGNVDLIAETSRVLQ